MDSPCPNCHSVDISIKDYQNKRIIHSVLNTSKCILIYKARRFKCCCCNKTFYEFNPFSQNNEKISTLTRILILDALRTHTSTFTDVAKRYNVSLTTVINIFDAYVDPARKPLPFVLSIDEFHTAKLTRHSKYACLLINFFTKEIIEVYPYRHKNKLYSYFNLIPLYERKKVKYVTIDMWKSYKDVAKMCFPNCIIAVDSFHVIRHLNNAIDSIRLSVMRKYRNNYSKLKHADMYYYMLKRFHFFFKMDFEKIKFKFMLGKLQTKWTKYEILKYLLYIDENLKEAYYLKEKYREFNLSVNYENCDEEFNKLILDFSNSIYQEYRDFSRLLIHWKKEIKNSFIRVNGKRLSNGPIEGVTSRVKTIIKCANGYTNFLRFRNRVHFSINKNEPILGKPK